MYMFDKTCQFVWRVRVWYRMLTGVQRRSTCVGMVQTECTAVDAVGNTFNLELFTWAMEGCYEWVGKILEWETGKKINRPLRNMHTYTLPLTGRGVQIYSAVTWAGHVIAQKYGKGLFLNSNQSLEFTRFTNHLFILYLGFTIYRKLLGTSSS